MAKTLVILLIFYLAAWFLFTYKLTDVPPGINGDEAAIGINSALIARTGYDSRGNFWPIFTAMPNTVDWKQPVTVYATVLAFKLFGPSYFALRAVSVILMLVSGTLIFLLLKELINLKAAILGLLIFTTIPIITIQSHLALESIAPIPFITLWLLFLRKYQKKLQIKYLIFAAVSLGLSIYSYFGPRLIVPVLSILTMSFIFYLNRSKSLKEIINPVLIFFVALIPFFLFLLLTKNLYPGAVFGPGRPSWVSSYQDLFLPYISSYDPSFLFISGDSTPYHSTGKHGMFLLASLPLFIVGMFKIIRKKNPFLFFILLTFFLSPALYGLVSSFHRATRLLILVPSFVVVASLGAATILTFKNKYWKLIVSALVTISIVLNFADFVSDYWFDYSNRVNQNFEKPIHKVFDYSLKLSKKENLTVFIQEDIPLRNIAVYGFFENAYFPNGLPRWKEGQPIPEKSIIMVSAQVYHRVKIPEYIELIDNGSMDLNLLINKTNKSE